MIRFDKYEALGNDFVLLSGGARRPTASLVRALCDRTRGVGADGVLWLKPGRRAHALAVLNADGSDGGFSGNGLRCAALHLARSARPPTGRPFLFATPGGTVEARVAGGQVELTFPGMELRAGEAPPARLDRRAAARAAGAAVLDAWSLDVGNPHVQLLLDAAAPEPADAEALDRLRRPGVLRPGGVNVALLGRPSRGVARLRVFERGVGPTAACASAALAAFLALGARGWCPGGRLRVRQVGGDLVFRRSHGGICMRGPARHVFEGRSERW